MVEKIPSKKTMIARIVFTLKYAYGVPAEILDHIDFVAYVDPTLTTHENLRIIMDAYPSLHKYVMETRVGIETAIEKAREEEEKWLASKIHTFEEALKGVEEAINKMHDEGFKDTEAMMDFLVGAGALTIDEAEAMWYSIQETKEVEEKREIVLPDVVRDFLAGFKLNIGDVPEPCVEVKPNYYVISVFDESTKEIIEIFFPSPTAPYKFLTITNKEGRNVGVLAKIGEDKKIIPEVAKVTYVQAKDVAEVKVPEVVEPAPPIVNWSLIRDYFRKLKDMEFTCKRYVADRNGEAMFTQLSTLYTISKMVKDEITKTKVEFITREEEEKKIELPKILTDAEYERLWKEYSDILKKEKIRPEEYKEEFEREIAWSVSYEENLKTIRLIARDVVTSHIARKVKPIEVKLIDKAPSMIHKQVVARPKRISWKLISQGIAYIFTAKYIVIEDAIREKNLEQIYLAMQDILNCVKKLMDLLMLDKNVADKVYSVSAFKRIAEELGLIEKAEDMWWEYGV